MNIIRLPLAHLHRLGGIERTINPNEWTSEVEEFVFGKQLTDAARSYKAALRITAIESEGVIIAAAVSFPDPLFEATTRIAALVVDPRHRGRGVGQTLLQAAVSEIVEEAATACWLVHPNNVGMLRCSRRIEPRPEEATVLDYNMFVSP